MSDPQARTLDPGAWSEFCEQLKRAGELIEASPLARNDFDRAEGLRYLSRLLRTGLESFVEHTGPAHPVFRLMPDQVKMGLDNPDNHYLNASIDGRCDYRIRGARGTIHYLSIAAQNQNFAARDRITGGAGQLGAADLELTPDGRFEIIASQNEAQGNWLRLAPDTKQILVRQTFLDRRRERPVEIEIECLTPERVQSTRSTEGDSKLRSATPQRAPRVDPARIAGQLSGAALYASGCASWFLSWVEGFEALAPINQFHLPDPAKHLLVGGDPNISTWLGRWSLEADEALIVEFTPPACTYWNFQLGNIWAESLDFRFSRVHINSGQATVRDDGSVRIVVAREKATRLDLANALDTTGHEHGTMAVRFVEADSSPEPQCRVVSARELTR